jgi:mono/diheme cytochrome c family protein
LFSREAAGNSHGLACFSADNLQRRTSWAPQKSGPLRQQKRERKNPVAVSESSLAAGQNIYLKRCFACHGKTGNGDGPDAADLGIDPAKLSDPAIRVETDGELFWKITVGKKPMPNYGTRLSPCRPLECDQLPSLPRQEVTQH